MTSRTRYGLVFEDGISSVRAIGINNNSRHDALSMSMYACGKVTVLVYSNANGSPFTIVLYRYTTRNYDRRYHGRGGFTGYFRFM